MARSDRIDNPKLREYIYQFVPEELNKNPIFVKVFGPKFANKKIKSNVIVAYSNETVGIREYTGYHNGSEKSITLCKSGKDGALLTLEEIANDEDLLETVLHEAVHAILARSEKECKEYGIVGGTGILERYKDPDTGNTVEIGRGLNEGFTEWMCEKAGRKPKAYTELTNFVRLLEVAVGTEKTMELGKGNTQERFPGLLSMTKEEVNYFLSLSDNVYIINDNLKLMRNMERVLKDIYFSPDYFMEEDNQKAQEEYDKYKEVIDEYLKDPVFLHYAKSQDKEPSEQFLQEYLSNVGIPDIEKQKNSTIINFESFILDRYFIRDIQRIFSSEDVSKEDFEKINKIVSLLNTTLYNVPDYMKDVKPAMSSLLIKREFQKFAEKYVKRYAQNEAQKYKKGEFAIKNFVEDCKKICGTNFQLKRFIAEEFSKNISIDFADEISAVLDSADRFSDNTIFLEKLTNASIYKIASENPELGLESTIIYDKENFFDRFNNDNQIIGGVNDFVDFDFTADGLMEDEYKVAMDNFMKLREEVFSRNPNAKIHIASRRIIVQDGNDLNFYMIERGELVPMLVENKIDLNFKVEDKEQNQEQAVAIAPVKVGRFASFINKIKRKWNDFKNRNNEETPNYVDENAGKIVFSRGEENSIDSYRVDDFDKRLQENRDKENDVQETTLEHDKDRDDE